jgi:hypothetical protein
VDGVKLDEMHRVRTGDAEVNQLKHVWHRPGYTQSEPTCMLVCWERYQPSVACIQGRIEPGRGRRI